VRSSLSDNLWVQAGDAQILRSSSAIRDMQRPITQKQLRSVLGLFGHFHDFIANYAELAKPLTDLTAKRVPQVLPWGEEAEQAFRCLKDKLCEASALAIHRPGDPVEIMVDASAVAIGACAMQGGRPIAYFLKSCLRPK